MSWQDFLFDFVRSPVSLCVAATSLPAINTVSKATTQHTHTRVKNQKKTPKQYYDSIVTQRSAHNDIYSHSSHTQMNMIGEQEGSSVAAFQNNLSIQQRQSCTLAAFDLMLQKRTTRAATVLASLQLSDVPQQSIATVIHTWA